MQLFLAPDTKERYLLSLLGGFIAQLVMGTIYTTGNVTIYMASYLQHRDQNITTSDLSIILPLQILGMTFTMISGPYLIEILSARYTLFLGITLQILMVFVTSYSKDYFFICLFYGLMQGVSAGISYVIPLLVSWSHFPKYKGRVSGVILGGFGLGSSIFNLIITHLVNPENKSPSVVIDGNRYFDSEISERYPMTLRFLCLVYFFLAVLAVLCITEPRPADSEILSEERHVSVFQGLSSKTFKLMAAMAFCSIMPGYFVANCFKVFGETKIDDDRFLAVVGSISSITNGSCRILWGGIIDRVGFIVSYQVLLTIQFILMYSLYYIAVNKVLYAAWISLILACEGGHFVLFSTLASQLFGQKNGAKIYSCLSYAFAIGAIFSFIFLIYIRPLVGYEGLILFLGSTPFISLFVSFIFKDSMRFPPKFGDIELT